ncbi:MAG: CBS domain-containing protein [Lachnospiraceae bacterium]|nr:CBS domain-containing protein [Lachnospiraceae bacterium]
MNILFFLTPKAEVACINAEATLRQVLEKLDNSGYAAIPIISKEGKYVGTITEGDLLWFIKREENLTLVDAEDIPISKIKRKKDNKAISITENMDGLWDKVINQNFVPVVDDDNIFIGIVTRKDIMLHAMKQCEDDTLNN